MTTIYTPEARANLEAYLATHDLPSGLGTTESACTLAAINLAMTGKLTDDIPDCMSKVIGKSAIILQDAMPNAMRNSPRYKALIPHMPGTGCDFEQERLAIIMDWMWGSVLPELQPVADAHGFGAEWQEMCRERTDAAAYAASDAAASVAAARAAALPAPMNSFSYAAASVATARAASDAAASAANAARLAASAANAARQASPSARPKLTSSAVAYAAACAVDAAAHAVDAAFWDRVDPIGVLERMTFLAPTLAAIKEKPHD